jgi:hypothetical protein
VSFYVLSATAGRSVYLLPALFCQLDTMIGNHLVDVAILVSFALRMANYNDHLQSVSHPLAGDLSCFLLCTHSWFAHLDVLVMSIV